MKIELKYGCNPHQAPAQVAVPEESHFRVLNGKPSYINILDALGAWQLARELKAATGKAAAASFKHTSPAGAAVVGSTSDSYRASQFLSDDDLSPVATAYVRARGGDRMSSFGDVAAVSDVVDLSLARMAVWRRSLVRSRRGKGRLGSHGLRASAFHRMPTFRFVTTLIGLAGAMCGMWLRRAGLYATMM